MPRENYLDNMTKAKTIFDHYDANVEDEKKERIYLEIGIEVKIAQK